jgi:hypothetical protein
MNKALNHSSGENDPVSLYRAMLDGPFFALSSFGLRFFVEVGHFTEVNWESPIKRATQVKSNHQVTK